MTLDQLAEWLETAHETGGAIVHFQDRLRAAAAACRELANLKAALAEAQKAKYDECKWEDLMELLRTDLSLATDAAMEAAG